MLTSASAITSEFVSESKTDAPINALQRYRIHKVIINPNYSLEQDTVPAKGDTLLLEGKYYINSDSMFKPKNIVRSVFLDPNEYYTREDHNNTIRRLMSLGMFKFANIRFDDLTIHDTLFLDAHVNLTPLYKRSLRAEILGIAKSTNFAGPALNVNFRNRNFLKGSELFIVDAQVSFEIQIGGNKTADQSALGSFELSTGVKLYIPKLLIPFYKASGVSSRYVPKTKFEVGLEQIYRVQYFTMNSFTFNYGFNWRKGGIMEHEFDP
jgi:outer membrane protein assembly factor BamA